MAHTPLKMTIEEAHAEVSYGWAHSYNPEALTDHEWNRFTNRIVPRTRLARMFIAQRRGTGDERMYVFTDRN